MDPAESPILPAAIRSLPRPEPASPLQNRVPGAERGRLHLPHLAVLADEGRLLRNDCRLSPQVSALVKKKKPEGPHFTQVSSEHVTVPKWLPFAAMHRVDFYSTFTKNCSGSFTEEEIRNIRAFYYAMCAEADAMLGKLTTPVPFHHFGRVGFSSGMKMEHWCVDRSADFSAERKPSAEQHRCHLHG